MPKNDDRVIVGVYASAPPAPQPDLEVEAEVLQRLSENPSVRGLEVPWRGTPYGYETDWYAERTPEHWEIVLTAIGSTMAALGRAAGYGLASADAEARRLALRDAAQMRDDVKALNDALGRRAVIGVELHSAPSTERATSSTASLTASLSELAGWDWDGADVLVEHCDQRQAGRDAAKGFLSLAAEIDAITRSQADIGLVVNWGRSAVELRDADQVAPAHVVQAREAGLLRAVVLSGASDVATEHGAAWADAHHPFAPASAGGIGCAGSLLTDARAAASLEAAGELDWIGLKVSCRPPSATLAQRLALLDDGVERVRRARRARAS